MVHIQIKKGATKMGLDMYLGLGTPGNSYDISTIDEWRKFYELNDFILINILEKKEDENAPDLNGRFLPIDGGEVEYVLDFLYKHRDSCAELVSSNSDEGMGEYKSRDDWELELAEKSIDSFKRALEIIKKNPNLQLYYCAWW